MRAKRANASEASPATQLWGPGCYLGPCALVITMILMEREPRERMRANRAKASEASPATQ
jgi:hypothetical protein